MTNLPRLQARLQGVPLQQRLQVAKNSRTYWYFVSMERTKSLSDAIKRAAEIEAVCADLEAQIRETEEKNEEV